MLPRVFLPLVFLSFSFPAFSQTLSGTRGNFRIVSDSGKVLINDLHADTVFLCFNKTFVFTLKSGKVGLRTFPEGKICDEVYDRITLGIVQDDFNDEPFFEGGVVRVFYSPDSTLLLKDISVPGGQRSLKFWPLNDSLYPVDDLLKYRTGVTVIADKNIVIKNDGGMTYDERSMTPEDPSFFISANAPVALAHASVLFHLDDLSHPIDSAYSFYYVKPYFFREDNYRFNGDLWFEHLISKDAVFRRSDSLAKSGMDSIQLAVLAAENHFAYSRSKDSVSSSGISFWSNNGSKGVFECSGDYPYLFITGYRDKALTWGGTDMSCSYTPASGRWVLNYHDPSDAVENMRKLVVGNKMSGFDFLSQQEENEFFWLYFQNGDRVSYDYLRNVFSPYAYGKKTSPDIFSGYCSGSRIAMNYCNRQQLNMNEIDDPDNPDVILTTLFQNDEFALSGIYDMHRQSWDVLPSAVFASFNGKNEVFSDYSTIPVDTVPNNDYYYGAKIHYNKWIYHSFVRDTVTGSVRPASKNDPDVVSDAFFKRSDGIFPLQLNAVPDDSIDEQKYGMQLTGIKFTMTVLDTSFEAEGDFFLPLDNDEYVNYSRVFKDFSALYRDGKKVNLGKYYPSAILSSRYISVNDTTMFNRTNGGPDDQSALYDLAANKILIPAYETVYNFANDSSVIVADYSDSAHTKYYVVRGKNLLGPYDHFDSTVYCIRLHAANKITTLDYEGRQVCGNDTSVVEDYDWVMGLIKVKSASGYNLFSTLTGKMLFGEWYDSISVFPKPLRPNQPLIIAWKSGRGGVPDYFATLDGESTQWEIEPAKKQSFVYDAEKGLLTVNANGKMSTRSYYGLLADTTASLQQHLSPGASLSVTQPPAQSPAQGKHRHRNRKHKSR